MDKKKDVMDTKPMRRNIVLAFWIAAILLAIEALRFFIEFVVKNIDWGNPTTNKIMPYWISFSVAIILLAFLINGFSKDIK